MKRNKTLFSSWIVAALAVAGLFSGGIAAEEPEQSPKQEPNAGSKPAPGSIEKALFGFYRHERKQAPVARVPALDEIARARASHLAGLQHEKRFESSWDLGEAIEPTGIKLYRAALSHSDMLRGYPDPAAKFQQSWSGQSEAWEQAMNPQVDAVGIGAAKGEDGWWILVVVMLEGTTQEFDVPKLEKAVSKEVDRRRKENGLKALKSNPELATIARAHCEDMIRRGYFDHKDPEGKQSADRLRGAGLTYSMVGENIFKAWGVDDIPATAAEGWMNSKGHRANILNGDYTETGMGVAVDDEGAVFITQLFYRP